MGRTAVIERLEAIRKHNRVANMAFFAYRDLNRTEPEPFLLAAVRRNPVSVEAAGDMAWEEIVETISDMPERSLYDEAGRLAQPDEVWNCGRGDGVEKAVLLANILSNRQPGERITIDIFPEQAVLKGKDVQVTFASSKDLQPTTWIMAQPG